MNMTIEQITAAFPHVAKLESQVGRELLEAMRSQMIEMAVKLSNCESKCRELAAENEKQQTHSEALAVDNAALREVVERMVNQFAMSGISPEEKSINPAKSLMFDAKSALFMPATDAFLAEVRAQGVEMLAYRLKQFIDEGDFVGDEIPLIAGCIDCAADMAAQLRQGVAL